MTEKLFAPRTRKAKRLPGFKDPNTARKAGKAGKGQAKNRGDRAHYAALARLATRARQANITKRAQDAAAEA